MPTPLSTAERLSKQCVANFGDTLRSVVLFGSVARGESIPGMSDINLLVLVEDLTNRDLLRAAPMMQDWVRAGNTPPYLFSSDEWKGMEDTFAIEIADMQDARRVIHGVDPIEDAGLSAADLRLHAEHEIRATVRHLRLRMLLSGTNQQEVGRLLVSGLPSFSAFMRACLRICGHDAPLDTLATIEQAAGLIGADPDAMIQCYQARLKCDPPRVPITDPLVEGYTSFVRHLENFIDRLAN